MLDFAEQINDIVKHAGRVRLHVDSREYEKAHCTLDDMEMKIHAIHRHIGKLQLVGRILPSPESG